MIRAIINSLRIDKLIKSIVKLLKADPLVMMSYYFAIILNMCMIWLVWYVMKWLMYISC